MVLYFMLKNFLNPSKPFGFGAQKLGKFFGFWHLKISQIFCAGNSFGISMHPKNPPRIFMITGNKNKFEEVKSILPDVEQLDINLPEIQDIDAGKIIKAKLLEALKHKEGEFIIEDTSLC